MDWTGAAVAAPACGAGMLALLWAGDWLQDEHGRLHVHGVAAALTAGAAVAGAVTGGAYGALAGLALVVAGVNVLVSVLLAWGLAGGDGEADSVVAGVLSLPVFLGSLAAFGVALGAVRGAGARDLALLLVPAVAYVAAQPFTQPPGRRRAAVIGGGLLALPAALLALA